MTKNSGVAGKTVFALARSHAGELRTAARAALGDYAQLERLDTRPGKSARERERLRKKLGESDDSTSKGRKTTRRRARRVVQQQKES